MKKLCVSQSEGRKLRRNGQDAPFPGYRKMNEDGLDKEKDWKGIWEKGGKRMKT
jgi:hypothetical protein